MCSCKNPEEFNEYLKDLESKGQTYIIANKNFRKNVWEHPIDEHMDVLDYKFYKDRDRVLAGLDDDGGRYFYKKVVVGDELKSDEGKLQFLKRNVGKENIILDADEISEFRFSSYNVNIFKYIINISKIGIGIYKLDIKLEEN